MLKLGSLHSFVLLVCSKKVPPLTKAPLIIIVTAVHFENLRNLLLLCLLLCLLLVFFFFFSSINFCQNVFLPKKKKKNSIEKKSREKKAQNLFRRDEKLSLSLLCVL